MPIQNDTLWEINEPRPLSPSVLYHLEALGVGTPYVESLTSFLKRLAQMHHVTAANLVAFCCEQASPSIVPTIYKVVGIDSITQSARTWVDLLGKLTCNSDVAYLTMVYWQPILNPHRLVRQHQTWCPLCYADWLKVGKPVYEPLLWRLQRVDTCLVHQCKLVDCCPGCGIKMPAITSNSTIGFCPKCRTWLGSHVYRGERVPITSESYQLSLAVGQLLTLAPQIQHLDKSITPQVIETLHISRRVRYTDIKKALRTNITSLMGIISQGKLPNLNILARLAILSKGVLWEVLGGQANCPSQSCFSEPSRLETTAQKQAYLERLIAAPHPLPSLAYIARTCGFTNELALQHVFRVPYKALRTRMAEEQRLALEEILDSGDVITVAELARRRGEHQNTFYCKFPELCRQVRQAFHERNNARCSQYLQTILQGDNFPSLPAIEKALGLDAYYLTQYFSDALNMIKAKRRHQIQQQEQAIQHYLDAALACDVLPPIPLKQIAAELGQSATTLKRKFPIQSQKILDRCRVYRADQSQAMCQRIQQIVFELHQQDIYPGVHRLQTMTGMWIAHNHVYRNAYIEAMTACGYLDVSAKSSLRHYIQP